MAEKLMLLLTLTCLIGLSACFQYSDLVAINATCPPKDTCIIEKGPRVGDSNDWKERNCFCDDLCSEYGDCCLDAHAYNVDEQQRPGLYECVHLKQFGDLYMRGTCMSGWEDLEIAMLCSSGTPDSSSDRRDPLVDLPVTSLDSSVTYTNFYCAVCNRDSSSLEMWKPRLECPTLASYQSRFRNLTMEYVSNNLVFNDENWGLYIDDNGVEVFHTCFIDPVLPETVPHLVRPCKKVTNTCASNWTDIDVENLCLSYTAVVYNFDHAYRNPHCAQCNYISQNYTCFYRVLTRFFFGDEFNPSAFSLLFDFVDTSGSNVVGSTSSCRAGEVFDPFFKKCRNVVCGKVNQEYRFGRCIDIGVISESAGGEVSTTSSTTTSGTTSSTTTSGTTSSTTTSGTTSSTTTSGTTSSTTTSGTTSSTTTSGTTSSTTASGTTSSTTTSGTTSSTTASGSTSSTTASGTTSSTTTSGSTSSTTASGTTSPTTTSGTTSLGTTSTTTKPPNTTTERGGLEDISITAIEPVDIATTISLNTTVVPIIYEVSTRSSNTSTERVQTLTCERFLLPADEFTMSANGTVVVEKYRRTYQSHEYEQTEGGILICIIQPETDKFSRMMGWVSLAGLGLSCVCLLLHLIAFLIVPDLRNLSGKNLASLCLVLLAAYTTFILSVFGEPGKSECFILAAAMYYFFLSSFCWMNVMAFDIWRTLKLATSELRVSAGGQWSKFILYTIHGWLLPAAALSVLVTIDLVRPDAMPAHYLPTLGERWCWFGQRKALLVFFAAPLVTIMLVNLVFFIFSARIIAETTLSTAKMTSCSPHQNQFKLYMRLALLMGLTWISGIVAGYLQMEPIWYIFVLLNTLQGVFIFLAFTCTRKVWRVAAGGCWRRVVLARHSAPWVARSPSSSRQGLESRDSQDSQLSHASHTSATHLTSTSRTTVDAF